MSLSPIEASGETVRKLFSGQRYQLGAYQREYDWSQDAVRALLNDLHKRFAACWREGHGRADTQSYDPYFLGPYVYHQDNSSTYLVDGQQRFTTLHLLLIYLRHLLRDQEMEDDASSLQQLIFTRQYGRSTYTIDIDERSDLLTALLKQEPYALPSQPSPSLPTMLDRYQDIGAFFPEELRGEQLPLFCDWLLGRVCLVGIQATDRDNGWEIFESMNNRGVPLSPVDLLKSHLLHRAGRTEESASNERWRAMLSRLATLGSDHPNAASRFVKTLLIAKYADLSEESDDLDQIERSLHEWVRAHETDRMGLRRPEDFEQLITLFSEYAPKYEMLAAASHRYGDLRVRSVYFNQHNGLDFQFPLIFAALQERDNLDVVKSKAELIAGFLDCVYVRRIANNGSSIGRLNFDTRALIPRLRETSTVDEIKKVLGSVLYDLAPDLSAIEHLTLAQNRRQVKYILARLTAFVDEGCGLGDRCQEYLGRKYDIEHIWSMGSAHRTKKGFTSLRNRLGGLLLLPSADNRSYRDDPYEQKLEYYFRQNWLAASLHPKAYSRTPDFGKFRREQGLDGVFRSFPEELTPAGIENRQELYRRLAEKVWDLGRFGVSPQRPTTIRRQGRSSPQQRKNYGVSIGDLIDAGMIEVGEWLRGTRRKETFWVQVLEDGQLRDEEKQIHGSLSGAGEILLERQSCQGWHFWHKRRGDQWVRMLQIRQEAIDKGFLEPPAA